jgi:glycosyltransferase involved in cell wall biosynthesis
MKQIKVVGDPNNTPSCSSEIIISSLNKGLKNIGLYDDKGEIVVYDCLANSHGHETNNIICPYETAIPHVVINQAGNRRLIGVSTQNQLFFTDAGYAPEKTDVCLLGVDTNIWKPLPKAKRNKFRFGMMCDSNTRAAYEDLLVAFGAAFKGKKDIELYIKDRWATPTFKAYVSELAKAFDIQVVHDDEHITNKEQEREIYNSLDCHVFLNRTSTFALTVAQGMAMGLPTVVMDYSGPRDYCNVLNACLVNHTLEDISQFKIADLLSKGFRNYLLPPNTTNFPKKPQWAVPDTKHLVQCLRAVYEEKDYREAIAYQAAVTASALTWERAAATLSYITSK